MWKNYKAMDYPQVSLEESKYNGEGMRILHDACKHQLDRSIEDRVEAMLLAEVPPKTIGAVNA